MNINGRFAFDKKSGLNFCTFLLANRTVFSGISRNDDNLAEYTKMLEIYYKELEFGNSTILTDFSKAFKDDSLCPS